MNWPTYYGIFLFLAIFLPLCLFWTILQLMQAYQFTFGEYLQTILQFSRSVVSDSLRPHESQHARPPCPSPTPGVSLRLASIESVMPSSHLIVCRPLLLLPPIPPSISLFQWVNSSHEVAKVLDTYSVFLSSYYACFQSVFLNKCLWKFFNHAITNQKEDRVALSISEK